MNANSTRAAYRSLAFELKQRMPRALTKHMATLFSERVIVLGVETLIYAVPRSATLRGTASGPDSSAGAPHRERWQRMA